MRETPRAINPVRIRIIDNGSGIRAPKTAVTTPKGNSIIPNFFRFTSVVSNPNGSVQELPRREIVAPAQASQTPVSKEDVITTFDATNRNRSGGIATNNQTPAIVRRPPYLDNSDIIPPATTKDTAKDAFGAKDASAVWIAERVGPVLYLIQGMNIEAIISAELTIFANRLARTAVIGPKQTTTSYGHLAKVKFCLRD
jgi:hypothetical protein